MDEETKKLLEENIRLTREVHAMTRRIRRYMALRTTLGIAYFLLIIGPLIFAFIYLPPIVRPYLDRYQTLFQTVRSPAASTAGDEEERAAKQLTLPELKALAEDLGFQLPEDGAR